MKTNVIGKKSVVICIVLLLVLSLNFTKIASSSPVKYEDDGVWFDSFDDASGIDPSKSSNYNLTEGRIKLAEGSNIHYYDFKDEKHEAWEANLSSIFSDESELVRLRNLFGQRQISNYSVIASHDSKVVKTQAIAVDTGPLGLNYTFSPIHHFRFKISQNGNNIDNFKFSWFYGAKISDANIDHILLYVWNYSALLKMWINEGTVSYSNIGLNPNGDIIFTSDDVGYVNDDGYMDFLIVAIPKESGKTCILSTDYVNLTVTSKVGYLETGYVVSTLITPATLGRWESVIWSSSKASDTAHVKIQVLNGADDTPIGEQYLNGNKDGFATSPLDLTSLPISISNIRLKALFNSSDLSITPQLYSWGALWQTQSNQHKDIFKTDLRIDKKVGVNIDASKIRMSDSYSDWPIFGKTTTNTRYYEGYGPQKSELYWKAGNKTLGGGLRSPVMKDGLIYIASSVDKRIYAFNATVPSSLKGKEISYRDFSDPAYVVDSSVAVADNFVIVATSKTNTSNKIYALNKSNLKDEKWSYLYPEGGDICFSSAPTVADEKVFVTSWNGKYWDTPLLSFLRFLIGGNNKIIALNLADGTMIWSKDLPAGSFSTPAVADGMVFVGCDNIYGNNIFAFNEETGEKIWNKSVGLIGGSSPVVFDGKVFVVVKEQGLLSLKGNVKIVALYEDNGTIAWNKTLAKNIPALEKLPRGLHLYNLMATSTPAVNENTNRLFVTSPDGKLYALDATNGGEIWSVDLPSAFYGVIPTYSCTSPVVTDDRVYVAASNGIVYALEESDGKELWKFDCKSKDLLSPPTGILASPIVADGVIYVSLTDEPINFSGRIYSIGDYITNQKARVISTPIHVPTGNWWNKFYVDYTNTTGSSITFSILDEDYNVLLNNVKNGGDISDSAKVNSNTIRLRAEFSRKNKSQDPTLKSWSVSWTEEKNPPVFTSGLSGWINTNTPTCGINVYDARPGLDIGSARYHIRYISDEKKDTTTDWISASCSGTDGTRRNETLTADISSLDISEHIADLKSITISIKDLAGNEATIAKDLKKDTFKPSSSIENINSFLTYYDSSVIITANASDPGVENVNKSGIKNVALLYRLKGTSDWMEYGSHSSPYIWAFEDNTSGNYEFCTVATDNAENVEDQPNQAQISFIFDMNKPDKPDFEEKYRFNDIPDFSDENAVTFKDDYKLEKVEYRLNFHGLNNWTTIKDDIDSKSYTGEWKLTKDDWDYMAEKEEYYLYFKLTDFCGNQYVTPAYNESLKIIKDLTTSKSYLDLSNFQEWHWGNVFTITANIPGDSNITKVELYYRYSSDGENWNDWEQYGDNLKTSPFAWEFTATEGNGYYEFKTKIWDASGMLGESPVESISVTLFPMIPLLLMIALAVILILVSAVSLTKMRKKKI